MVKMTTYPFECLLNNVIADTMVRQINETSVFEAVDNLTSSFAPLSE